MTNINKNRNLNSTGLTSNILKSKSKNEEQLKNTNKNNNSNNYKSNFLPLVATCPHCCDISPHSYADILTMCTEIL